MYTTRVFTSTYSNLSTDLTFPSTSVLSVLHTALTRSKSSTCRNESEQTNSSDGSKSNSTSSLVGPVLPPLVGLELLPPSATAAAVVSPCAPRALSAWLDAVVSAIFTQKFFISEEWMKWDEEETQVEFKIYIYNGAQVIWCINLLLKASCG